MPRRPYSVTLDDLYRALALMGDGDVYDPDNWARVRAILRAPERADVGPEPGIGPGNDADE